MKRSVLLAILVLVKLGVSSYAFPCKLAGDPHSPGVRPDPTWNGKSAPGTLFPPHPLDISPRSDPHILHIDPSKLRLKSAARETALTRGEYWDPVAKSLRPLHPEDVDDLCLDADHILELQTVASILGSQGVTVKKMQDDEHVWRGILDILNGKYNMLMVPRALNSAKRGPVTAATKQLAEYMYCDDIHQPDPRVVAYLEAQCVHTLFVAKRLDEALEDVFKRKGSDLSLVRAQSLLVECIAGSEVAERCKKEFSSFVDGDQGPGPSPWTTRMSEIQGQSPMQGAAMPANSLDTFPATNPLTSDTELSVLTKIDSKALRRKQEARNIALAKGEYWNPVSSEMKAFNPENIDDLCLDADHILELQTVAAILDSQGFTIEELKSKPAVWKNILDHLNSEENLVMIPRSLNNAKKKPVTAITRQLATTKDCLQEVYDDARVVAYITHFCTQTIEVAYKLHKEVQVIRDLPAADLNLFEAQSFVLGCIMGYEAATECIEDWRFHLQSGR